MSNVEEILRQSIKDKCGLGGLMRFNALYTGGFETAAGRPDAFAAPSAKKPAQRSSMCDQQRIRGSRTHICIIEKLSDEVAFGLFTDQ